MAEFFTSLGNMLWSGPLHNALEIAIIALLIYQLLRFLRGTRAIYILIGVLVLFFVINSVAKMLNFETIQRIIEETAMGLTLGLLIGLMQYALGRSEKKKKEAERALKEAALKEVED